MVTAAATVEGEDLGFSDDDGEPETGAPEMGEPGLSFLNFGGWTKVPSGLSFFGLPKGFEPSLRGALGFLSASLGRIVTSGVADFGIMAEAGWGLDGLLLGTSVEVGGRFVGLLLGTIVEVGC